MNANLEAGCPGVRAPIVGEIAEAVRREGAFRRSLTGEEVAGIMKGVVAQAVSSNDSVQATVPKLTFGIIGSRGTVQGELRVTSPIKAVIGVDCSLTNGQEQGTLALETLALPLRRGGLVARAALGAIGIESRARGVLGDPNGALVRYLDSELAQSGLELSSLGLQFRGQVLDVEITGHEMPQP